jgi:DNA topoisomerase-2
MDIIRDRLENLSIIFPKIQFKFNGETIKFRNLKTVAANFSAHTVTAEADGISMVIAPSGSDEEFRCLSYVNNIFIKNGGSHVDYAMHRIIETVRAAIKKKHKVDILPNQVRQHRQ